MVLLVGLVLLFIVVPALFAIASIVFPDATGLAAIWQDQDSMLLLTFMYLFHAHIVLLIVVAYVKTRYILKDLANDPALQVQYGDSLKQLDLELENHIEMTARNSNGNKDISLFVILSKAEFLESFMAHLALEC